MAISELMADVGILQSCRALKRSRAHAKIQLALVHSLAFELGAKEMNCAPICKNSLKGVCAVQGWGGAERWAQGTRRSLTDRVSDGEGEDEPKVSPGSGNAGPTTITASSSPSNHHIRFFTCPPSERAVHAAVEEALVGVVAGALTDALNLTPQGALDLPSVAQASQPSIAQASTSAQTLPPPSLLPSVSTRPKPRPVPKRSLVERANSIIGELRRFAPLADATAESAQAVPAPLQVQPASTVDVAPPLLPSEDPRPERPQSPSSSGGASDATHRRLPSPASSNYEDTHPPEFSLDIYGPASYVPTSPVPVQLGRHVPGIHGHRSMTICPLVPIPDSYAGTEYMEYLQYTTWWDATTKKWVTLPPGMAPEWGIFVFPENPQEDAGAFQERRTAPYVLLSQGSGPNEPGVTLLGIIYKGAYWPLFRTCSISQSITEHLAKGNSMSSEDATGWTPRWKGYFDRAHRSGHYENRLYGPVNEMLEISFDGETSPPNDFPVLFLEVKDDIYLKTRSKRLEADHQIRERFREMLPTLPSGLPHLWGLSLIGRSVRVYQGSNTTPYVVDPGPEVPIEESAWYIDLLEQEGFDVMKTITSQQPQTAPSKPASLIDWSATTPPRSKSPSAKKSKNTPSVAELLRPQPLYATAGGAGDSQPYAQYRSLRQQTQGKDRPTTKCQVQIPITHCPIRVISDIDDTVKDSGVLNSARAVFYNACSRSLFNGSFSAPTARKRAGVEDILKAFPDLCFFLIGDSSEQDMELYAELAQKYPDNVLAIFIRGVTTQEGVTNPLDDPTGWNALVIQSALLELNGTLPPNSSSGNVSPSSRRSSVANRLVGAGKKSSSSLPSFLSLGTGGGAGASDEMAGGSPHPDEWTRAQHRE
ncbi:hypothetical protein DFP72DRAFT_849510 [Ephemerocybe angulata]|uniref:Phosphatidate phosphatase APP1 catalytic domain-containing protein n=1 Tax=Ephemerocybe angulata TaxID=980116 RepID=A0A8H6M4U6_9AGAR|nr:hypothetical protein DFP72DRAFT_849510 [Tulosesus angulatus]